MELTRFLLELGAPLLLPGSRRSALDQAIERDNEELLDVMLHHGHPDQQIKNGALVTAVQGRYWKASTRLLEAGADPSVTPSAYGKCCDEPLLDAVLIHSPVPRDFLKAIIAHKVNPNVRLRTGYTPLMHVLHDHELMKAFLDIGADPNAKVDRKRVERLGDTVLHLATRGISSRPPGYGDLSGFAYDRITNPEIRARSVELLLRYGAKPDVLNKEGMTPLMLTSTDDAKSISLLFKAGGHSINTAAGEARHYSARYKIPVGPVTWALLEGNETLAAQLVRGNSALQQSDCGAIFIAAAGGAVTTLNALLDLNTRWNAVRGTEGETPLIAAARAGHASTVILLLDRHAADVNEATPFAIVMSGGHGPGVPVSSGGYTALIETVRNMYRVRVNKHKAVVEELIKHGADINHKDYTGHIAMDYARRANADEIMTLLRQSGARE